MANSITLNTHLSVEEGKTGINTRSLIYKIDYEQRPSYMIDEYLNNIFHRSQIESITFESKVYSPSKIIDSSSKIQPLYEFLNRYYHRIIHINLRKPILNPKDEEALGLLISRCINLKRLTVYDRLSLSDFDRFQKCVPRSIEELTLYRVTDFQEVKRWSEGLNLNCITVVTSEVYTQDRLRFDIEQIKNIEQNYVSIFDPISDKYFRICCSKCSECNGSQKCSKEVSKINKLCLLFFGGIASMFAAYFMFTLSDYYF